MNAAIHQFAGMQGLGAACGAGTATAHAAVAGGMQTAAGILLMVPDPTMVTKIAAAVLEVGSAVQNFFFHPDCSKIATTQIVNQAEQFLQQNLAAWQSLPASQKTPESQQAALMNFDNVWAQVVKACGTGQYGTAGINCIADRQQGACHYQNNGACWNWFVGYRDPIANDPNVVGGSSILSGSGIDSNLLIVLGAAGLLLVVALS